MKRFRLPIFISFIFLIGFFGISNLTAQAQDLILSQWATCESTTNSTCPVFLVADVSITASVLSTGGGLIANTGSTYNWRDWDLANTSAAAADSAGDYFQWSIAPGASGLATLSINEIDIRYDRSSTGPDNVEIHYSLDGFSTAGTKIHEFDFNDTDVGTNQAIDLSGTPILASAGETVTFRLYAFNSESTAGTFDLENNSGYGDMTLQIIGTGTKPTIVSLASFSGDVVNNASSEILAGVLAVLLVSGLLFLHHRKSV